MSQKSKDPDADLRKSPEFKAFEDATKQILRASKTEIDKKLAEKRKRSRPASP